MVRVPEYAELAKMIRSIIKVNDKAFHDSAVVICEGPLLKVADLLDFSASVGTIGTREGEINAMLEDVKDAAETSLVYHVYIMIISIISKF